MISALLAALLAVGPIHGPVRDQAHASRPEPSPLAGPRRPDVAPGAGAQVPQQLAEGETLEGNYLFDVLKRSPVHAETLAGLLRGERALPPWVRNMVARGTYVAGASTAVTVNGQAMELFTACEAHNCADSQVKVLFSADGRQAFLRVVDKKQGQIYLGDPSPEEKAPLMKPGL